MLQNAGQQQRMQPKSGKCGAFRELEKAVPKGPKIEKNQDLEIFKRD